MPLRHDRSDSSQLADQRLMHELTLLAAQAAATVSSITHAAMVVREKLDHSPVTSADEASQAVMLDGLARILPGVAVVSEESVACAPAVGGRTTFVLVDPLDGTREFVAGRDEFTVNVALIEAGEATAGVIAAPALGMLWRGARGHTAERMPLASGRVGLAAAIRARKLPEQHPVAFVSRSHLDPSSASLLDRAGGIVRQPCGSALKFCRLAEGIADLYPRLAPTSEWDVAAGNAVLAAAGGAVHTPAGRPLVYGNSADRFRVPAFIAYGDANAARRLLGLAGAVQ
ncbi:MAG TPA: 3'(2'),5'-bisphosphate nucleotidase CysQ [Xanthobacteraceae bacterium]|nr:3'(2'),5'-bisphosphate nucleotidase CysQ [Xanthobacteraceae bacterium]